VAIERLPVQARISLHVTSPQIGHSCGVEQYTNRTLALADLQLLWRNLAQEGRALVEDPMQERRRSPRHSCRLLGRIYFDNGRRSMSCLIQDISYEGARIVIFDPIDSPDEIKLCIPEKTRMGAR
jgi:PilZ domain